MEPSKANDINLSDVLNALKHTVFIFISGTIAVFMVANTQHIQVDWETIKTLAITMGLNAASVLVNRYFADNTK